MKKILFVHQASTIGGASYCMLSLLRGLDKSRFEPIVMLRNDGLLVGEIRKLGIRVIFFDEMTTIPYNESLCKFSSIITYLKVVLIQKKFAWYLNELKIDVVYLNNMMLYPYLRTSKLAGCKTIMHVREHWPKDEHQYQMKRARNYAWKYADAMIAINKYSASLFPECFNKVHIIYDWFDIKNRNERRPYSEIFGEGSEDLKVFLFTGGLGRIKGTHVVVRTFQEKIHGNDYRLLMMGAGLDYKLQGLSGKIKKILMLTGWKPYGFSIMEQIKKDNRIVVIPPTYNMVDIYRQAFCTLSYFTIPHANLALAEAVALGTVAIAARTEESIEYSDGGEGAILFNINDSNDFIEKINYVIANQEVVKKQAEGHSENIKMLFSPEFNIEKLNHVCDIVCIDE
ncbi:MAG: glycosyltransferase family 4 protein [Lachnospiraceae bacterium]|nr:glycosyltransferase family 4 protein [Lachnospiraceae bacterium]